MTSGNSQIQTAAEPKPRTLRPLVVVPVYNHPGTLREVVTGVLAAHPDLVVVDDGSVTHASQILEGLGVEIIRHPTNLGKGKALVTGARYAEEHGFTHLISIDADGQHDPAEIPRFVAMIEENPHAIVVGLRDFDTDNVPASSRFGRSFSNFWLRVQTGCRLGDVQSGYRAYPVSVLTGLDLSESRFSFEVEVLVKGAWAGVELKDLDIGVIYQKQGERISHFNKLKDNLRLTRLNAKLTMMSMMPWRTRRLETGEDGAANISVIHPVKSLKLLLSEDVSPGKLAAAVALGVSLGALPLIAIHTLAILFVSGYFKLNRVAAVSASQLCMPPIVPALCIEAGYYMRHGEFLTEISFQTLGYQALERLWEWVIGSLVVAPVLGIVTGLTVFVMAKVIVAARSEGRS